MGTWGGKKYEGLGMKDVNFTYKLGIQQLQKTIQQKFLSINAQMIINLNRIIYPFIKIYLFLPSI